MDSVDSRDACGRAWAIETGLLVDVSEKARHAGFKLPLALTAAVWAVIGDIPAQLREAEDVSERLANLLWMASGVSGKGGSQPERRFQVVLPHARQRLASFKLVAGAGDDGKPVLTLMLLEEGNVESVTASGPGKTAS